MGLKILKIKRCDSSNIIKIAKSPTADTRSCDFANVDKQTLLKSSNQHIVDVQKGLAFFADKLREAGEKHDFDKIRNIDQFHSDFIGGFESTKWWDEHRKINRHHLQEEDGIPSDVNLIDVLEMISDCIMAGMARTGHVYPIEIPTPVLQKAFLNTVELLKQNVQIEDKDK